MQETWFNESGDQPLHLTCLLGGSAWLVSTYDIYYVLKALSKYLLHLG